MNRTDLLTSLVVLSAAPSLPHYQWSSADQDHPGKTWARSRRGKKKGKRKRRK
jgi:hypothetical protein